MFIEHVIEVTDRIMEQATENDPLHPGFDRLPNAQAQTVLLVDDDPVLLDVICNFLSRNGLRVLPVNSGEVAVNLCRGYVRTIDVLVSDVEMHPVNGFELVDVVRSVHPQVTVVLISGKEACPANQPRDGEFLLKPFALQDLLAAILRRSREVH